MSSNRKPIFGVLSVVLPLAGLVIASLTFTVIDPPEPPHQLSGLYAGILFFALACAISGIAAGLIGWIRAEQHYWISIFGFLFSLFLSLSYFVG